MNASLKEARAAKARAAALFGELVGDVAIGVMKIGEDRFGLKVNLLEKPAKGISLPRQIQGVPIKVEVVGTIRKRR